MYQEKTNKAKYLVTVGHCLCATKGHINQDTDLTTQFFH